MSECQVGNRQKFSLHRSWVQRSSELSLIVVAVLIVCTNNAFSQYTRVPASIVEQIVRLIDPESSEDVLVAEANGDVLTIDYKTATFSIHRKSDLVGRRTEHPEPVIGPNYDGVRLELDWSSETIGDGGLGQAAPLIGFVETEYWFEWWDEYEMKDGLGFIRVKCQFGEEFRRMKLAALLNALQGMGTPRALRFDWWQDHKEELRAAMTAELQAVNLEPVFKDEGETMSWEWNTRQFQIHPIDSDGRVSAEAKEEVGPTVGGLIVRVTKGQKHVRMQARPKTQLIDTDYWYHYTTEPRDGLFRVEVLYGMRTERKHLAAISAALANFGVVPHFEDSSIWRLR